MAVSKLALGMNARNYLYIRPLNLPSAKRRADHKLATKNTLILSGVPTTRLIASFRTPADVRGFAWKELKGDFVLKPARGFGGGGIVVVHSWKGTEGTRTDGRSIDLDELEAEIFSTLDGAYSLDNLPDTAFLEERVVVSSTMRKICSGGIPDIRIIVCNRVPIMAMLRLPTAQSGGKANLHQGALGIGIDLRTGITTKAVYFGEPVDFIPGTRTKVRGIKLPDWDRILGIAVQAQEASKLGYAGVDLVLDERLGPLVLEVNARPGLQIQLANGASLRTRLERVADIRVPSLEYGIELGKQLFAETALVDVQNRANVLGVIEKVTIYGKKGKKVVDAKIDTGAFRTSLDVALVEELDLDPHHQHVHVKSGSGNQTRHTVKVAFRLRGKEIETIASYTDRAHLRFPVIIGRRDLEGFLVDPSLCSEDVD